MADSAGIAPIVAVTSGEPAGVGPELCLRLIEYQASARPPARIVILGDKNLLAARARLLGAPVELRDWRAGTLAEPGVLDVLHVAADAEATPGKPTPSNSRYVLRLLDRALAGCRSGEFAAMATAPVHKGVINDAGIPFTGHTEYLAEKTHTARVVMMLAGGNLRVALATTHLPLRDVPAAITRESLEQTLRILHADMRRKYGIARPRILVAGLNPHAGEGGYLGDEEITVIGPTLEKLRGEGLLLTGPLPADTLFTPPVLARGDCVLAMYHDQGLTALKYATFGHGINVTLGLPVIRTSVDHGTALELAGTGRADPGSLFTAVDEAARMAGRRQGNEGGDWA
ncbi:MAG: 4-hydroxythreonine-4-phosphate dehydrogenase PdxA [Candidatus Accumulibacter sp.]|jgi:4-hydroxythreonine-4-phosphate dehydrogenase|nr:4-hydroxythreonine-4-phosphate dehydrogenase PdxA [Accumulibacter sp.]